MRTSIPRRFSGAKAQIVFMPQKSIIQHEFPLKLGLELSIATRRSAAVQCRACQLGALRPTPASAILLLLPSLRN